MQAAILAIGDELILGQSMDTNSAWLARELGGHGVEVLEFRTVADDEKSIAAGVRELAARRDLLLLSGGLGPTEDDRTRLGLAAVFSPGDTLVEDQEVRDALQEIFPAGEGPYPSTMNSQAMYPRGMSLLPNPHGTAPGLSGEWNGCRVIALPGPPAEMKPMFEEAVRCLLPDSTKGIVTATVQSIGMGEPEAAGRLGALMERGRDVQVSMTASGGVVTARLRSSSDLPGGEGEVDAVVTDILDHWYPLGWHGGLGSVAAVLAGELTGRGWSLSTAESCTGGWIARELVRQVGSSSWYRGGWVTYSDAMKTGCLGVPEEEIRTFGAVSAEVSRSMASGACVAADADCAVSVTGIAGPTGGSVDKPVGTVWVTVLLADAAGGRMDQRCFTIPGSRNEVQQRSAALALQMTRLLVMGEAHPGQMVWETSSRRAASQ